jgi:synaptobrevin family protein YKT6
MVKIFSIIIIDVNTFRILANAFDLSSFSFFQRNTIREFMTFTSRTIVSNTSKELISFIQATHHNEYVCYSRHGIVLICDKEYPNLAAYSIINNLLIDQSQSQVDKAIIDFQDPTKADKLLKLKEDLEKTTKIIHNTIDSILERNIKIDELVKVSEDLGVSSKLFYAKASEQNKCCVLS